MHMLILYFFFNDTATTEIYTLSLHDALPISPRSPRTPCTPRCPRSRSGWWTAARWSTRSGWRGSGRSEEHTSELQSRQYLVCRLLLEKKKKLNATTDANHISNITAIHHFNNN